MNEYIVTRITRLGLVYYFKCLRQRNPVWTVSRDEALRFPQRDAELVLSAIPKSSQSTYRVEAVVWKYLHWLNSDLTWLSDDDVLSGWRSSTNAYETLSNELSERDLNARDKDGWLDANQEPALLEYNTLLRAEAVVMKRYADEARERGLL